MDFNDTPEQAKFRSEVYAWLSENADPKKPGGETLFGRRDNDDEYLRRAKEWQAKKAAAGWAALHWPVDYGGRGATPMETIIYRQEEARFDVPQGVFAIGLGMCAPVLMTYADEETKKRLLPKMITAEEVWCQLFSEPAAGSDLAGLRTRAVRDGDDWVINGQKVWTSGAHYCDYGILVTRHDPTLPKHKGLTFFWLDMKSAGIEIKPIKQASGASSFNEVFFTNVRIPDSQRLGEVGEGWQVSLTTLMNERLAVGGASPPDVAELMELARTTNLEDGPAIADPSVRSRLADWYVEAEGLRLINARTLTALGRGATPGPEASITKVVSASKLQDISAFGIDLMEMGGTLVGDGTVPAQGLFQRGYLSSPGFRIAGGSDEILRNIIAERVLNLPSDIRVDRDRPFNEIPTGSA